MNITYPQIRLDFVLKYVLLICFLSVTYFVFLDKSDIKTLLSMSFYTFLVLNVIQAFFYYLAGCQYSYFIKIRSSKRLTHLERLSFPLVMSFWSFMIPVQGSLIYFSVKIKDRFGINISLGLSFLVYLITLNLITFGIFLFYIWSIDYDIYLLFISIVFIFNPLILIMTNKMVRNLVTNHGIFGIISDFLNEINQNYTKYKITIFLFTINTIQILLLYFKFVICSKFLGFEIGTVGLVSITLISRISVVLKLTPGNLGIEEFITGVLFTFIDYSPSEGILIVALGRIPILFLSFVFGIFNFNNDYRMISDYFPNSSKNVND